MWILAFGAEHLFHLVHGNSPTRLVVTFGAAVIGCYIFVAVSRAGSRRADVCSPG
jgi:hypothetical protein